MSLTKLSLAGNNYNHNADILISGAVTPARKWLEESVIFSSLEYFRLCFIFLTPAKLMACIGGFDSHMYCGKIKSLLFPEEEKTVKNQTISSKFEPLTFILYKHIS
jgi:hypothetical protein